MRNRFWKSLTALTVFSFVLALAAPSFAQSRGGYSNDRWQNDRWEDGRWQNDRRMSRINVSRLIRQAEDRSDQFVILFDRALDRSRFDGTLREDRLNERARHLERELNIVRQQFERTNNLYALRSHIANAMEIAQGINNVMHRQRLHPTVERHWSLLRSDLNRLAGVFNVRPLR